MMGIFELSRYVVMVLFATAVSVSFAGMAGTRKNILVFGCFCAGVFLLQFIIGRLLNDMVLMLKIYPLLCHVPIVVFIVVYLKRPPLIALTSVFLTFLCYQAPRWLGSFTSEVFKVVAMNLGGISHGVSMNATIVREFISINHSGVLNTASMDHLGLIAGALATFFLLQKHVVKLARDLMERSVKSCLLFGALPFMYYVFDYTVVIYTDLMYSGNRAVIQFMPFFTSALYLAFVLLYYGETQKQARLQYEADFARDIVASGREHYQKMNEQYEALRIMRHDYKFHLNAAIDMLNRGEVEKGNDYLSRLKHELADKELPDFCDNQVINALVADYAQRCEQKEIKLDVSINIPKGFSVPNYEMCIVIGNLLENAVEACQKLEKPVCTPCGGTASADPASGDIKPDRIIELVVKPQGVLSTTPQDEASRAQLAIMVRNTFDGKVVKDGEQLISTKKDGGIGLQSVKAVVERSGEIFITDYDDKWFNAYVFWGKKESK